MGDFSGTVTFITGASSGIGAALALEIARRGGDVALAARREERLKEAAAGIEKLGRRALPLKCDVTAEGDLERAVEHAISHFGRIDYAVANAGFGVAGPADSLGIEDYRRQFETNVFGVLRTVKAVRDSLAASRGCLAITGSVNGFVSLPGTSAYAMSKHAVHGLAEALRHEFKPLGVAVVLIVPGFIETEIRRVNNFGALRAGARDKVPRWLRMPAGTAARQIASAMRGRVKVRVITFHGKAAVFLKRHFPWLLDFVISRFAGPPAGRPSGRKSEKTRK